MKYLQKRFSVPAGPPGISQEEWDRIFAKEEKPRKGKKVEERESAMGSHREDRGK